MPYPHNRLPVDACARRRHRAPRANEPLHLPARARATQQHKTASKTVQKSKSTSVVVPLVPHAAVGGEGGAGGKVIAILPAQAWKGCREQGRWLWRGREGDLCRSDHAQAADWLWPAPTCFEGRRAICRTCPAGVLATSAPAGGRASDALQSQRLRSARKRAWEAAAHRREERGAAPLGVRMARLFL